MFLAKSKTSRDFVKITLMALVLGVLIFKPIISSASTLSDLESQAANLDRQIQATQSQLNSKQHEVNSIQDIINGIQNQIKATTTQINLENKKIDLLNQAITDLSAKIDDEQKKLVAKKADLDEAIRTSYEIGNLSTLEVVLGSNSLAEASAKAQYVEALNASIESNINEIKKTQAELNSNKTVLESQQSDLVAAKESLEQKQRSLASSRQSQQNMLNKSASEQSQFQAALAAQIEEKSNISAEIYALRQSQGGYVAGGSSYIYASSTPDVPDRWGFLTRECTSYAAWYWNMRLGKPWYNTRPGAGSAYNWPALAYDQGYSVSSTPRVGAIASWGAGGIYGSHGHVAIVEAVNANGTINVSEYNWIPFAYDQRYNISPGGARFIY